MSIDLLEPCANGEPARQALDEFHGARDEFTAFFDDVFDELQGLSLELYARHKCQELSEQQTTSEASLSNCDEEFRRPLGQLAELRGQLQSLHSELRASQQQTQKGWAELFENAKQQQAEVAGELRRIRCLLEAFVNQVRGDPAASAPRRRAAPD